MQVAPIEEGFFRMTDQEPQFLDVGSGPRQRRVAYRVEPSRRSDRCGIMWFIGLKSDMQSTKALALQVWALERGLGFTRFDYSGHGQSSGDFQDATIGDWLEEATSLFLRRTTGPQILVGSSTGAHIALLLLRQFLLNDAEAYRRIKGVVLIAPAWDVTELIWSELPDDARSEILSKGVWHRPSEYDPKGYPITRTFFEDGRRHLIAGAPFDPGCRIDVLQGLQDRDVPAAYARRLGDLLLGDRVRFTEVPDGEHRLSRPQDLALLYQLVEGHLSP